MEPSRVESHWPKATSPRYSAINSTSMLRSRLPSVPLQTTLDGIQVLVNGTAAPLYYVSPGQINFEIPIDAATGDGTVQVVRNGTAGNLVYVDINAQVPRFIV